MNSSDEAREELEKLEADIERLKDEEKELRDRIDQTSKLLERDVQRDGEDPQSLMYVTQDDLKSLQCYKGDTVIAIRAPQGELLANGLEEGCCLNE